MDKKKSKRKKKVDTWKFFLRLFRVVEIIAIIGGVIFAVIQIRDVRNMQSAQLMLEFNKDLSSEINSQIITAIENNKPIFQNNGGAFTTTDIDKYLTVYELISNTYGAGLITDDMLYNAFSYDIIKTYENGEIKDYLLEIRKEDELFFAGFEWLAKSLQISK